MGTDLLTHIVHYLIGESFLGLWCLSLQIAPGQQSGAAKKFFVACKTNDEATKQQYANNYFPYTLDALKQHVYVILVDVENLTMQAQSYDLQTQPRVP